MTAALELWHSFDDYLQVDDESPGRHEFLPDPGDPHQHGIIVAMAGGTPDHAALAVAVAVSLSNQLRGMPCRVYSDALRVRSLETGFAGYPDVTVVCGKFAPDPADKNGNTCTNPVVVVEVLSPGTEKYDRGAKLRHYQSIPSVRHVVLVAHQNPLIEVWSRGESGWHISEMKARGGRADLPAIECTLDVDEIYRDPLAGA